ncbi:MAG TPA: pantoate--beta-alanine ligase [Methylomusa anaerophila]|uniref:pantoate--beta-alanine ligase n=1 Tax=Methylomusa anaerophila TaxID=1930071 RepID=UPI0015761FB2|nr:pantoate--beta-alanine ligase [Methylomusa anaerophila]HML88035.1 pantoate--beta-alanine ligase [Methylomusa anaerophila]
MTVIEKVAEMRAFITQARKQGKTIGFIPTMGALHEGHLTLMQEAKKCSDVVVASIFVNPTQFGPNEDYDAYPRTWPEDLEACSAVGVDVVFRPSVKEMYPNGWGTWVTVAGITDKLCGKSRPNHFRGVTTVVAKLFNIVQPDKAFFGQKDAQQVVVLTRMAQDLNMPVEIVMVPIVREPDGVAKSSRNSYLTAAERKSAPILYKSLCAAQQLVSQGEQSVQNIVAAVVRSIKSEPMATIDYVEIHSFPQLEEMAGLNQEALLAVAAKFGATRLIDNIILKPGERG